MIIRTNPKIEKNSAVSGHMTIVPAIQNYHMAAPAVAINTDYSVFKKTAEEKTQLKTLKQNHNHGRLKKIM